MSEIKVIIGLGNPGPKFFYTRHNIGFRVLDALAKKYNGHFQLKDKAEIAQVKINYKDILLIKPHTFMNNSGEVIPYLQKKGYELANILVVHDELELPVGEIKFKMGGSSKGHNGLKSIISFCGSDFARLRVGISRPENREQVPDYVLSKFNESDEQINQIIDKVVSEIEKIIK